MYYSYSRATRLYILVELLYGLSVELIDRVSINRRESSDDRAKIGR